MENQEYKCIVSAVKLSSNPIENVYTAIDGRAFQFKSASQLALYDNVAINDETATRKSEGTWDDYAKLASKMVESLDLEGNSRAIELAKEYEAVSKRLMPELVSAAKTLAGAFVSGAPIVVRFHNDGDGSSGGIAVYRALASLQERVFGKERAVSWQMNRSIAYTLESFYIDRMLFNSYESAERPVVLITDFGTSPESEEAIKASQESCDLIWLDHHIPYEGFPKSLIKHYINVFDFGGDSNFTAGLLTCIFAQVLSKIDVSDLKEAALVSDFSSYANFKDERAIRNSIILDYLTSSGNEMSSKPKHMDSILSDPEKSDSAFKRANGMLEEAISAGLENIASYRNANGINIHVLDFGHVAKLNLEYPLPGRYSSKLQERLEARDSGKTITIVHYGSFISMRTSKDLHESINIIGMIEKLKSSTNGAVSGGGHRQAASIRTDREHIKEVTKLLLEEFGIGAK